MPLNRNEVVRPRSEGVVAGARLDQLETGDDPLDAVVESPRVEWLSQAIGLFRRRANPRLVAVIGVIVLAGCAVLIWLVFQRGAHGTPSSRAVLGLEPVAGSGGAVDGIADVNQPSAGASSSSGGAPGGEAQIIVHVVGAVTNPGVYRIRGPSRVIDAIAAAGGSSPDANLAAVNLAAEVADGSQVFVPKLGEMPAGPGSAGSSASGSSGPGQSGPGSAGSSASKINLNSASGKDLEALPGVGPATAEKIVRYRREHGRFRTVDDLRKVGGIGESKLAEIRPLVVV